MSVANHTILLKPATQCSRKPSPSQTSFGHVGGHTSSPLSVDSSQINHRQANAKKKKEKEKITGEDQGQRDKHHG
ncbi:hypothetical protein ACN38_g4151 [Penicillium nordicum]|uniref:Uncharacterized protein n=1 Tax=Penicillium nordicum TaxID=229535 RepID=A0A0M9WHE3_9EURO|nr:hypothetical protein ACN38_g4151 [Penicillium nordicum]